MHVKVVALVGVLLVLLTSTLTVVLHLANVGSSLAAGVTDWWLTGLTMGVGYSLTGGWLLWRRPDLAIGVVLLGIGGAAAAGMAALEYGITSLGQGGLPLGGAALWLGNWMWAASMVAVVALVPHLLPEGRVPPGGRRRLLWVAGVLATLAVAASWMVTPYAEISPGIAARADNPFAVVPGLVRQALLGLTLVGTVVSVCSLGIRWHRSRGAARQQLKWVLVGVVAALHLFAAGFVLGPLATAAAMVPVPAAIVLAVLRTGLWDVDVVISRGLTWLAVVLALTSVFVGVQAATATVADAPLGARWPGVLAAAATVALAQPLHRALQREVNLRVHGAEDDPVTVLTQLGRRLVSRPPGGQSAEALLGEAMVSLRRQLRIEGARLTLADGGLVGAEGDDGALHAIPLTHLGRDVGALHLPLPLDQLTLGQRRQVAGLLPGLAVSAHGALLERMLEHATAELAGIRQDERRELHRELHDELGPSLAAMALKVEIAADLLGSDPARAELVLKEVAPQLAGTVAEVRSVVLGLRPTALEQLGLEGALRELAAGFTGPAQRVNVSFESGALHDLHAATEVAAYRIAAEALTNAHRHAQASSIELEVRRLEEMLELTITDDGTGISADHRPGVGLASMSGRAAEVGGRLQVGPSPHGRGTRVWALLAEPSLTPRKPPGAVA